MKQVKKAYLLLLIVLSIIVTTLPFYVMAQEHDTIPPLFSIKFGKYQVFDCQRSPAYPEEGKPFYVFGFIDPYIAISNASHREVVDWGVNEDRYIMFSRADSATDSNARLKLTLYERDGTEVRTVSEWGYVYGLFDEGLFYEGLGHYGYIFSIGRQFAYEDSYTFTATTGKVTEWSMIEEYLVERRPIVSIEPTGSEVPVSTKSLICTFSKPIDITVPGIVKMSPDKIEGNLNYSDDSMWNVDNTVLTIPMEELEYSTQYTIGISGFQSIEGIEMEAIDNHTFVTQNADLEQQISETEKAVPKTDNKAGLISVWMFFIFSTIYLVISGVRYFRI